MVVSFAFKSAESKVTLASLLFESPNTAKSQGLGYSTSSSAISTRIFTLR